MTNPHHAMSHPLDPHPVRPGTSAALTARTIDATIHPPLVRAQEAVAAFIPRVSAPISNSPLLFAMLGSTLIFVWVAHRAKYRPSALLLSAALVMALTSFHPVKTVDDARVAEDGGAAEDRSQRFFGIDEVAPTDEAVPSVEEVQSDDAPVTPEPAEPPAPLDELGPDGYSASTSDVDASSDSDNAPSPRMDDRMMPGEMRGRMVTPDAMRRMMSPETIRQMMSPEELATLELERQQLRIAISQMRRQLREEARRMEKRRDY